MKLYKPRALKWDFTVYMKCNRNLFSTIVKLNTFNMAAAARLALKCAPMNEHALRYLLGNKLDFKYSCENPFFEDCFQTYLMHFS